MALIEIQFECPSQETREILIALLSEEGYQGFEETDLLLKAFIEQKGFDEGRIATLSKEFAAPFTAAPVATTNWNKVWESSFEPVIVDRFCAIRAEFHEPITDVEHELIITPKMSFGTGHHATTFMMIRQMRDFDLRARNVLDFGTGTGVLAILASLLGAAPVTAIDNDTWSIDNARENMLRNDCNHIELLHGEEVPEGRAFDIILANVTRNVILDQLPAFAKALTYGGVLLTSGLLADDEEDMIRAAAQFALHHDRTMKKDNWLSLRFEK